MSTRTDALVPQLETGKINCVHLPHYGRLPPGAPDINARTMQLVSTSRRGRGEGCEVRATSSPSWVSVAQRRVSNHGPKPSAKQDTAPACMPGPSFETPSLREGFSG
ncbi:MAG TPA: hypothetical protein VLX44_15590 [Xanthobacteraceae bacterium]|nr:hypothetical protein [Xanthobacteraceae bacterium]